MLHQAALALREMGEKSSGFPDSVLSVFPRDPLLQLGLGTESFLPAFASATQVLATRFGLEFGQDFHQATLRALKNVAGMEKDVRLIHGDHQPKNLLFDRGEKMLAVIDWELAMVAPLLLDFAKLIRFASDDAMAKAVASVFRHESSWFTEQGARSNDLLRVGLGLAAPVLSEDSVCWLGYLKGCVQTLLEGDPEPARLGARNILHL